MLVKLRLKALLVICPYRAKSNHPLKGWQRVIDDAEARIFEIISYAILKNHYKNIKVYFGDSLDDIKEEYLELFKTGRTNANDGGIDFVCVQLEGFFK